MVFSSLIFIYAFLPIFLIIYFLIPGKSPKWIMVRNAVLLIGSLYFYAYGEYYYVIIMIFSILINYLLALGLGEKKEKSFSAAKAERARKGIMVFALFINLGILFFFKYYLFFAENINNLILTVTKDMSVPVFLLPEVRLENPVGISFYTFQILSYVIDVYRRKYPPEKNILVMGTYIAMFPQLIAGPIVEYPEVRDSLRNRKVEAKDLDMGIKTFIMGLAAKVVLANQIGILWSDLARIGYESISTPLAWMGAFAYSFQIYFDFFGYSLMAIGLGRMMGFSFPDNFKDPYASCSVTEFWRRWHITLGRWLKNYLYIPLGGSRCSMAKTIRNIFFVWLFTGLWHGADWNFIIWGMLFFVLALAEKLFWGKILKKCKPLSVLYMLLVIPLSWVIFAIQDLSALQVYFTRLFPFIPHSYASNVASGDYLRYGANYAFLFGMSVVCCIPAVRHWFEKQRETKFGVLLYLGMFFVSIYFLALGLDNPFLYYRF